MAGRCSILMLKENLKIFKLVLLLVAMATAGEAQSSSKDIRYPPGRGKKYIIEHNDIESTRYLGETCSSSTSCRRGSKDSVCREGVCTCLPYHIAINSTTCLPTVLLGFECSYHAQCSLRVPNAGCIDGICQCSENYSPYHRHICLPPAQLGHKCFSDEQCKSADKHSHCKFILPNLYGRCYCDADTEHFGRQCIKPKKVIGSTCATSAECQQHVNNSICLDSICSCEQGFTVGWVDNRCIAVHKGLKEAQVALHAASLGQPCATWAQCQAADPNSACINGVCDCLVEGPIKCGWNNTGCHPSTFQCRSTGSCISPALTCNGHPDCEDSSDETSCDNQPCPLGSFPCGSRCISGMFVCDGIQHCDDGSDEANCRANEGEGCPGNGFRCNNGDCIPEYGFCNSINDCIDGSDEPVEVCKRESRKRKDVPANDVQCPYRCANGKCRSKAILCTKKDGCGDDSDESQCSVCRCPSIGQLRNAMG